MAMNVSEIAKQLEVKEFRDKNYKQSAIYIRYADQIVVTKIIFGGDNHADYLTLIIYKNGTFDFKSRKEQLRKGSKNPLIGRYNYDTIMNAIENKNKSDLEKFKYIIRLISIYSKIIGGM